MVHIAREISKPGQAHQPIVFRGWGGKRLFPSCLALSRPTPPGGTFKMAAGGQGHYEETPCPAAWPHSGQGTTLSGSQLANGESKSTAELGTLLPPAAATDCRDLLRAEGRQAAVKPTSPEPA